MITPLERAQIRANLRRSNLDARWRRTVTSLLDTLDAYDEAGSWIRTVERNPDSSIDVLVLSRSAEGDIILDVACFRENGWFDTSGQPLRMSITHWMHLPQPPAPTKPWLRDSE